MLKVYFQKYILDGIRYKGLIINAENKVLVVTNDSKFNVNASRSSACNDYWYTIIP